MIRNFTGFQYIGKQGNHHLVSDGIRTLFLDNQEFRVFSRQLFNREVN